MLINTPKVQVLNYFSSLFDTVQFMYVMLNHYIRTYTFVQKFLKRRVWRLTLYYNSPEKVINLFIVLGISN